ncbi:MAG: tRNA (adenosine(37)-N6)-threonylcarbamoyltransferase complex transferase subunit TsaD [Burkholderiales bacterium]|nr:tRNA (adenosine(37)-N6)-threonylcarbamoyltransferase complex transferase subunit TsaD [Burkholderiales bacterium]
MRVLGIETSCDETGVAVYDSTTGLLAHALHSQVAMHRDFGGVVPELASRDHVRRVIPLIRQVVADAETSLRELDGIAYTQGPGLAGALLVGAGVATALAYALRIPAVGVHHLEGHLLSPLLASPRPEFPFVALLVSGGHSQLFDVAGVGEYRLLGDTLDDAAGEAFDKTAKLLGLPYPGGPALAQLAQQGTAGAVRLPRPMLRSGDLDFSFSGLKTAVLTLARKAAGGAPPETLPAARRADIALEFESAIVDVLEAKSLAALDATGHRQLVVAGGVGANRALRGRLAAATVRRGAQVYFPDLAFCTDNGAMIALVGALRLAQARAGDNAFSVRPRWDLSSLTSLPVPPETPVHCA